MVFRQLFDPVSSTYTYLLADDATGRALLIDPVFEQFERDRALLAELGLELSATLETHVHADHVTAAWRLRQALGSQIVLSGCSGASGADRLDNTLVDVLHRFGKELPQYRRRVDEEGQRAGEGAETDRGDEEQSQGQIRNRAQKIQHCTHAGIDPGMGRGVARGEEADGKRH